MGRFRGPLTGADDSARIPLHPGNPATLHPAFQEPRYANPDPLSERGVDRRLRAALAALLGKDGPGLSNTTIARLKDGWFDDHKQWSERHLPAKSYIYVWTDGVYLQARLEDEAQCILASSAPRPRARRSCSALSTARARALTTGAPCCSISSAGGLSMVPKVAVADGALGLWKATGEVSPKIREQRMLGARQ